MSDVIAGLHPNPTQAGLRLGIPRASLSNFINGKARLAENHLAALAHELGADIASVRKVFETMGDSSETGTLRDAPSFPGAPREGLSWLLADYTEATLLEKINKVMNDAALPLATRLERAEIFWSELKRRSKNEPPL